MATKEDRTRIELTTERVRERIAWLQLRSSQVQLKTAWVKFATVGDHRLLRRLVGHPSSL